MKSEKLSPRQLAAAVLVGGLSTGAAVAGRADWRWILVGVPVGVVVGWLLLRRVGRRPLHPVVRVLYCAWAVVLMADVLSRTAARLQSAAGGQGNAAWLVVLLVLPLVWMGWGKAAAFFRAVEIFWLAAGVTVAAVLLLGVPRMDWHWAMEAAGDWRQSLLGCALTMCTGLFVLPYLYKVEEEPGGTHRGLVWLGALGLITAALAALTAGLLSPAVAAKLDAPFFAAAGLLGDSARLEGLVSALWLLPDLTLVGLLSRTWGERQWPALGVLAALGVTFIGIVGMLPVMTLPLGCLGLAVLTAVFPAGQKK